MQTKNESTINIAVQIISLLLVASARLGDVNSNSLINEVIIAEPPHQHLLKVR
jgi:hypothetical protein